MSVVIVGVIRRKPVLTHASIVCEGMLASVNFGESADNLLFGGAWIAGRGQLDVDSDRLEYFRLDIPLGHSAFGPFPLDVTVPASHSTCSCLL